MGNSLVTTSVVDVRKYVLYLEKKKGQCLNLQAEPMDFKFIYVC